LRTMPKLVSSSTRSTFDFSFSIVLLIFCFSNIT